MSNKILWILVGYLYLVVLPALLFFKGADIDDDDEN